MRPQDRERWAREFKARIRESLKTLQQRQRRTEQIGARITSQIRRVRRQIARQERELDNLRSLFGPPPVRAAGTNAEPGRSD